MAISKNKCGKLLQTCIWYCVFERATGLILKDDGTYVYYTISQDVPVYKNNRSCQISDILPETDKVMVREPARILILVIDIENTTRPISGFIAAMRNTLICHYSLAISGVQEFVNDRWEISQYRYPNVWYRRIQTVAAEASLRYCLPCYKEGF